jgi:hypothetical protein
MIRRHPLLLLYWLAWVVYLTGHHTLLELLLLLEVLLGLLQLLLLILRLLLDLLVSLLLLLLKQSHLVLRHHDVLQRGRVHPLVLLHHPLLRGVPSLLRILILDQPSDEERDQAKAPSNLLEIK